MSPNAKDKKTKADLPDLSSEEEAALVIELSAAYHMDEISSSSRDVQRIAEKVQARMSEVKEKL